MASTSTSLPRLSDRAVQLLGSLARSPHFNRLKIVPGFSPSDNQYGGRSFKWANAHKREHFPSVPTLPRADKRGLCQKVLPKVLTNENRTWKGSTGWKTSVNAAAAVGVIREV